MTLHWWMHWFWVTANIVASLTIPVPGSTRDPLFAPSSSRASSSPSNLDSTEFPTTVGPMLAKIQLQNSRMAKAIGYHPPMNVAAADEDTGWQTTTDNPHQVRFSRYTTSSTFDRLKIVSVPPEYIRNLTERHESKSNFSSRVPGKKETKTTWIQAAGKSKVKYNDRGGPLETSINRSAGLSEFGDELSVLPLRVKEVRSEMFKENAGSSILRANNKSDEIFVNEETVEPQLIATAASILDAGSSDSTRLGRAGDFTSVFQREQIAQIEHSASSNQVIGHQESNVAANSAAEIATITGGCIATVLLLSTVGSLGFIAYRRRYLNPPQTLNSDKCSNPDSSGYIDDSTIRDNSEEMYSLDNDSFLNSLEAMTIQNYWTDVKHTKL